MPFHFLFTSDRKLDFLPPRIFWAVLGSFFVFGLSYGAKPPFESFGFWSFQKSGGVIRSLHQEFLKVPGDWRLQSGALGLNLDWERDPQRPWYIEYQRLGGDFVEAGLAEGMDDAVDWGLKIIDWGFSRMDPDGGFSQTDRYHSASFFVEAVSRALLLIQVAPCGERWKEHSDRMMPKLAQAARWMARSDVHAENWPDPALAATKWGERRYGHRRFLDAAALGQTGILIRDEELLEVSRKILRDGLAFQRSDGVSPEKNGHDSSYQAVGLMYACRYYQIVAEKELQGEMRPHLERGFSWMLSRIRADGSIEDAGNTRTGPGGEIGRRGKPKTVDFRAVAIALAHWAWLTDSQEIKKISEKVFEFGEKKKP